MTPADELPNISETELEVLRELWDRGPQTVRQLHATLEAADRGRAYTTVQTLLYRLEEKGYVTADRTGSAHVFAHSVSRDSLLGRRLEELASKLCDGAAGPLVLNLVEHGKFSAEEIARFRQLLDDHEARSGRRGKKWKRS